MRDQLISGPVLRLIPKSSYTYIFWDCRSGQPPSQSSKNQLSYKLVLYALLPTGIKKVFQIPKQGRKQFVSSKENALMESVFCLCLVSVSHQFSSHHLNTIGAFFWPPQSSRGLWKGDVTYNFAPIPPYGKKQNKVYKKWILYWLHLTRGNAWSLEGKRNTQCSTSNTVSEAASSIRISNNDDNTQRWLHNNSNNKFVLPGLCILLCKQPAGQHWHIYRNVDSCVLPSWINKCKLNDSTSLPFPSPAHPAVPQANPEVGKCKMLTNLDMLNVVPDFRSDYENKDLNFKWQHLLGARSKRSNEEMIMFGRMMIHNVSLSSSGNHLVRARHKHQPGWLRSWKVLDFWLQIDKMTHQKYAGKCYDVLFNNDTYCRN